MTTTSDLSVRPAPTRPKVRHLLLVATLTFAWCALWGEASAANLLSGVTVSGILVYLGVRDRTGIDGISSGKIRIVPLLRLIALVASDLAQSTLEVAKEVVSRSDESISEAVLAVEIPEEAKHHLLLMVVAITVTPGTAVIESDLDKGVLYLHILHFRKDGVEAPESKGLASWFQVKQATRAEIESHVQKLAGLACAAFPADDEAVTTVDGPGGTR